MDTSVKVITVWVAYALGIVVTGTPFAGVIMAYFCRSTNTEPGFAGHNRAQIRLFWWAFLGWMIAIGVIIAGMFIGIANDAPDPPALTWVGLLIGFGVQIVFTIISIIGIVRAANKTNWPGTDIDHPPTAVFG